MTPNQQRYETNAATCRAIGHFLEIKRQELKMYCSITDPVGIVKVTNVIIETQEELDILYDEQIDLFFVVQEEKRLAKIAEARKEQAKIYKEYYYSKQLLQY